MRTISLLSAQELCLSASEHVNMLMAKAAQEARRRSLNRRQNAVKDLESELELLTHQVEVAAEKESKVSHSILTLFRERKVVLDRA